MSNKYLKCGEIGISCAAGESEPPLMRFMVSSGGAVNCLAWVDLPLNCK